MAPKKRLRFTLKKKAALRAEKPGTMNPLPDPVFSDLPLPPLRLTDEAAPALLPWLAMGFAPVKTSGKDEMCGVYALWRAFREAREALKDPGEKIKHISQATFLGFLGSQEYNEMAEKVVNVQAEMGFGSDNNEELREILAQASNLDVNQIGILLELANEAAGTNFALGFVTQGWRCKLDQETKEFDNNFVSYSVANLPGDPLGDSIQKPARPVIWLWNDNHAVQQEAWGQGLESLSHWEGFGRFESSDYDRRERVRGWGIGGVLKLDLDQGVWMVTKDCDQNNEDKLEAVKGTFVRDAVPNCIVPPGWRFVVAYNSMQGLVPMDSLELVELNHVVSSLMDEQADADQEAELGLESEAGQYPGQVTEANDEEKTDDIATGHNLLQLKFFRAISTIDKMGQTANENLTIAGFDFKPGDILLDSAGRRTGTATMITANGKIGEAHPRRLQHLEFAWGFPSLVHGVRINERNNDEIKGNDPGSATSSLYQHSLPLYRLTRSYSAAEAQSETGFFKGEIVRGLGLAGTGGNDLNILDVELKTGRVDFGSLETFGCSGLVGQHDYPFGIQLLEDIPTDEFEVADPEKSMPVEGVSLSGSAEINQSDEPGEGDGWEEGDMSEAYIEPGSPSGDSSGSFDEELTTQSKKAKATSKHSQDDDPEESPKEKKQKTG